MFTFFVQSNYYYLLLIPNRPRRTARVHDVPTVKSIHLARSNVVRKPLFFSSTTSPGRTHINAIFSKPIKYNILANSCNYGTHRAVDHHTPAIHTNTRRAVVAAYRKKKIKKRITSPRYR